MQQIKTDTKKNRLYLRLSKLTEAEMADNVIEVANAVKKLKPGFTCLTEIGEITAPTEKEKRMVRLVMEYLSMMRVSRVVRVGERSVFNLLDENSREAGSYSALHANTLEAGEALLDELRPPGSR